jgi:hypothetical protein
MDGDIFAEESAVLDELAVPQETAGDDENEREREARDEPPPPETGDQAVDEATAEVAATAAEPLETRLAAYERAHRTLQDRLADVEG